jgi:hypothetical protein
MKKTILGLTVAVLAIGIQFRASTNAFSPPTGMTGAPGESTCTSCHSGNSLNGGPGSVTILGLPSAYVPGTMYPLQVKVTDGTKSRYGFEMVALNNSNQQAGTFALVSTTNSALLTSGGKSYAMHRNATNNSQWTINWTAPATNVGAVKLYVAGNAANNNNNDTGDNIYSASFTLNPASATGFADAQTNSVTVFPNPASEKLNLKFPEDIRSFKIVDLTGREIHTGSATNAIGNQVDVSKFPNGTYFLHMEQEKTSQIKRFIVQH